MVSFSISLTITSSFFSTQPPTTEIYTLSLHDALPISCPLLRLERQSALDRIAMHVAQLLHTLAFAPHHKIIESPLPLVAFVRSEEHTSELQSHSDLVCRLLLEKKKNNIYKIKKYTSQQ